MQKACLRVENLHKTFTNGAESLAILRGVTAAFDQGGLYAITGVSGSGKSTLMHLLAGIDSPTKGEVLFNGVNLAQLGQDERERFLQQSIGLVFQLPYLISELSVIENIMVPGLISGKTKTECCIRAMEILEAVGLADKALCNPHSLSGGQQQRVALARALYNKPVFLIADEPTGSLDEHASRGIIDLLLDCQREWGMGVIISSHDMYVTNCMKTIYHLKDGILSARNNESFEIA